MYRRVFAVAALLGATTLDAQRQPAGQLSAGDRVRARLAPPWRATTFGILLRATSDSLQVRRDVEKDTLLLNWRDIEQLDVSTHQFTAAEGARRGARAGFLIGAVVSTVAIVMAVRADRSGKDYNVPATGIVTILGAGFTLGTTLVGSGLGAAAPGERWLEVYRREEAASDSALLNQSTTTTRSNGRTISSFAGGPP